VSSTSLASLRFKTFPDLVHRRINHSSVGRCENAADHRGGNAPHTSDPAPWDHMIARPQNITATVHHLGPEPLRAHLQLAAAAQPCFASGRIAFVGRKLVRDTAVIKTPVSRLHQQCNQSDPHKLRSCCSQADRAAQRGWGPPPENGTAEQNDQSLHERPGIEYRSNRTISSVMGTTIFSRSAAR